MIFLFWIVNVFDHRRMAGWIQDKLVQQNFEVATPQNRIASVTKPPRRVFLFLHSDDFWTDHQCTNLPIRLRKRWIEEYGTAQVTLKP